MKIIKAPEIAPVRLPKLQVIIVDCSGSMYWAMSSLKKEIASRINESMLAVGDALLIGLFSSKGWTAWPIATTITGPQDYEIIRGIIEKELYARNMTCFSTILQELPSKLANFTGYNVRTLSFMSDGRPTVPNHKQELADIEECLTKLADYFVSGSVLAFGDYADIDLLRGISRKLGLEFNSTYSAEAAAEQFRKAADAGQPVQVDLGSEVTSYLVYGYDGTAFTGLGSGKITITSHLGIATINPRTAEDEISKLDWLLLLSYIRAGNYDQAIELASGLGDVYLVNRLANIVTTLDLSNIMDEVRGIVNKTIEPFKEGRQPGYLPDPNAPSVIDLLTTLTLGDAKLVLDQDFHYRPLGRKSETKPGYPKFVPGSEVAVVPFKSLVTHEKNLNLSVSVKKQGTVEFTTENLEQIHAADPDSPTSLDKSVIDCVIYRSYNIINNGKLILDSLKLQLSDSDLESLRTLLGESLFHSLVTKAGEFWTVNLKGLSLCNKKKAESIVLKGLLEIEAQSTTLGAMLKVYKAKLKELDPSGTSKASSKFSEQFVIDLKKLGFSIVGDEVRYSPPSVQTPSTDVLDGIELFVTVTGATIPTVAELKEKAKTKKPITNPYHLAGIQTLQEIDEKLPANKAEAIVYLSDKISSLTEEKRSKDFKLGMDRISYGLSGKALQEFAGEETKAFDTGKATFRLVEIPV